jgi:hypothetical protein
MIYNLFIFGTFAAARGLCFIPLLNHQMSLRIGIKKNLDLVNVNDRVTDPANEWTGIESNLNIMLHHTLGLFLEALRTI